MASNPYKLLRQGPPGTASTSCLRESRSLTDLLHSQGRETWGLTGQPGLSSLKEEVQPEAFEDIPQISHYLLQPKRNKSELP